VSDQTSIFNKEQSTEQQSNTTNSTSQTQSSPDPLNDLLGQIKNERGEPKYKSVQDALNGLLHAQNHIQTLLTEKRQVDEELNTLRPVAVKVSELEKVVERLTQPSQSQTVTPTAQQGFTEEQVAKLVEQTMTRNQQQTVAKANLESVVNSVKKHFGDKAEEVFYAKAAELGMNQAEINALAARTPAATLKLLGITAVTSASPNVQTSSINTSALEPNRQTFISRNATKLEVGATHQDIMREAEASRKMIEEMGQQGMSIDDLTKPSNYFKYFGK